MTSDGIDRRLSAILSTDVVGYSRHMAEHAVETVRSITLPSGKRSRASSNVTTDASWIAPATICSPSFPSAIDATRCAIEMQQAIEQLNEGLRADQRMEFRIGVHLGEVLADEDNRIYGSGVNIAARLEGLAQRRRNLHLRHRAGDRLQSASTSTMSTSGEQELKNIPQPLRVFEVSVEPASDAGGAPAGAAQRRRGVRRRWVVVAGIAVIVVAALASSRFFRGGEKTRVAPAIADPSVAVIPFLDLSEKQDQSLFCDVIADDLTTGLAQHEALRVASRSAAFTYKNSNIDAPTIGRELSVADGRRGQRSSRRSTPACE